MLCRANTTRNDDARHSEQSEGTEYLETSYVRENVHSQGPSFPMIVVKIDLFVILESSFPIFTIYVRIL